MHKEKFIIYGVIKMETVLITGITGFIGGELAHRLIDDYEVHGIVKQCRSRDMSAPEDIKKEILLHEVDITDYMSVENVINQVKPDKILHLAALSPVRASFEHPLDYNHVNAAGTINVVHALHKLSDFKDRRLVIASTAEVYGLQPKNKPFTEELPFLPSSPYACAKAYADTYVRMMCNVYDFNAVVLRCVNSYGRKYDKSFFIEYIIDKMINNEDIYVGAPDSIRDYMYVDDHVNAYILAMEKGNARGQVFNAGTGIGVKNRDVALKLADMTGFDRDKLHLGQYPPGYPTRPITSDQPYLVLDATKIKRMLNWPEPMPFEKGAKKAIGYWASKK